MPISSHNIFENVRTRVIVTHDGKMLMLEPTEKRAAWRLPGGGLELNESLNDCAVREVMEETGIAIQVTTVAFLREFVVPKYCIVPDEPDAGFGLEVYLYGTPTTNQLEPRRENPDAPLGYWLPYAEVARLPLWPKELKTLARWMADGNIPQGVPSFATELESPDAPAPDVKFG